MFENNKRVARSYLLLFYFSHLKIPIKNVKKNDFLVLRKKNVKKNDFFMFVFTVDNIKKTNIIKIPQNFTYF